MRIYLVVAVWDSTRNNHAGMFYLANQVKQHAQLPVSVVRVPTKAFRRIKWLYPALHVVLGLLLYFKLKKGDIVFLMESLFPGYHQEWIARIVRSKATVLGIAHLVPSRLSEAFQSDTLVRDVNYYDSLIVLGSSLKDYLVTQGAATEKIQVSYHYVDTDYYSPLPKNEALLAPPQEKPPLKILCIGNMERNYAALSKIIDSCPDLDFIICSGRNNLSHVFGNRENAKLKGFMEEEELRGLMQECDVSLNVMNDTIGSNAITTSMSTGLVVLASDVGSIRDYVTDQHNGFLFNDVEAAIRLLKQLDDDRELCRTAQKRAIDTASDMSIKKWIEWFLGHAESVRSARHPHQKV